jgi:hypothetical protein
MVSPDERGSGASGVAANGDERGTRCADKLSTRGNKLSDWTGNGGEAAVRAGDGVADVRTRTRNRAEAFALKDRIIFAVVNLSEHRTLTRVLFERPVR